MPKKAKGPPLVSGAPQAGVTAANYWLLQSEPDVLSWKMLVAMGMSGEEWSGIRDYPARNSKRAMKLGDVGFFYVLLRFRCNIPTVRMRLSVEAARDVP